MKVFVSYAQPDHRFMHVLSGTLIEAGITPIVAAQVMNPGRRLKEKVRDLIRDSDCMVVLNTNGGARSRWFQQEIGCAKALGKIVIPLRTRNAPLSAMLEGCEYHTFSSADPHTDFARIADYLRQFAEKNGIPVLKVKDIGQDEVLLLHLPHALVCPKCKCTEVHVFLCLLCGDWLCTACGTTIPPESRASGVKPKRL